MERSSASRIFALLRQLGIERAHVGGCMSGDWGELVRAHAGVVHSLTIVAPHLNMGTPDNLDRFEAPVMVIAGDQGAPARRAYDLVARFANAELLALDDYASPAWADTIADRTEDIAIALDDFLARAESDRALPAVDLAQGECEIAGINCRILGSGPPMVLLPLSFAPSQWTPLLHRLSERCCTILLSGAHLGAISLLEARANSGYGTLVTQVLDQAKIQADETVLEVGCGSGALARALAKRTEHKNSIIATDINPYLLSEARALTLSDNAEFAITFEEANAEALPFPDTQFDVVISCTVLEEGQADHMLRELVRVTKPGGRVVVMTRAIDAPWWVNLPVSDDLKTRLNVLGPRSGAGVGDGGCADSSLYERLVKAGLTPQIMGPQLATYRDGDRLNDVLDRLIAFLPKNDADVCRSAARQARTDGTLFVAEPFHCAIGVKPSSACQQF